MIHEDSNGEMITDEKWQAIISNDASYNNHFFYAVKTTGIFCKPSCKSRIPKKENVRIFQNAEEALSAHFRPCKRCKPTNERLPDNEWVELITEYIDKNYTEKLTLETLAEMSHGSPYHLHRTFKRVTGISPVEYIQRIRINTARNLLLQSDLAIAEIGKEVGIPNIPYFVTLFKKRIGSTPAQYRKFQGNLEVPQK
ncbi:bifunctional transcriptional activator/DNA repair enzyme AdaA [Neobacillus drentensis]|uniref:bifunctional transcriptional activator/DNA repair enzyme AdaA n=1 Tax=Neobacillus drentensis TaxID=220684 RepID=UPI003001DAC1